MIYHPAGKTYFGSVFVGEDKAKIGEYFIVNLEKEPDGHFYIDHDSKKYEIRKKNPLFSNLSIVNQKRVDCVFIGKEFLNNQELDKYKLDQKYDDKILNFYIWCLKDTFYPVKIIFNKGIIGEVTLEITDIIIKEQPEELFKIPDDYEMRPRPEWFD
jgi:hypothetical protein